MNINWSEKEWTAGLNSNTVDGGTSIAIYCKFTIPDSERRHLADVLTPYLESLKKTLAAGDILFELRRRLNEAAAIGATTISIPELEKALQAVIVTGDFEGK